MGDRHYFTEKVCDKIDELYSRKDGKELIKRCQRGKVEQYEKTLSSLRKRYEQRHRYKIHPALDEARDAFNEIFTNIEDENFRPLIKEIYDSNKILDHYRTQFLSHAMEELEEMVYHRRNKVMRSLKRFDAFSSFLSFTDIEVSVALIVAISYVSHLSNKFINTFWLGIGFLVLVAFFKVTLDRFLIMPYIERVGWRYYLKTINSYEDILAVVEAITLVSKNELDEASEAKALQCIINGLHKLESPK